MTDLAQKIRDHLHDQYGLQISTTTIGRFVKKNTKRSHATKLNGCPYCHRLQYEEITADQRRKYLDHKAVASSKRHFKTMVLQAVADEAIPDAVVASMDFTKFDTSAKCKSVECHIIVLRYGPSLAAKIAGHLESTEPIHGLHRIYCNIFGSSSSDKHDPDFVYFSWKK